MPAVESPRLHAAPKGLEFLVRHELHRAVGHEHETGQEPSEQAGSALFGDDAARAMEHAGVGSGGACTRGRRARHLQLQARFNEPDWIRESGADDACGCSRHEVDRRRVRFGGGVRVSDMGGQCIAGKVVSKHVEAPRTHGTDKVGHYALVPAQERCLIHESGFVVSNGGRVQTARALRLAYLHKRIGNTTVFYRKPRAAAVVRLKASFDGVEGMRNEGGSSAGHCADDAVEEEVAFGHFGRGLEGEDVAAGGRLRFATNGDER